MKKVLAILFAVLMAVTVMAVSASAADSYVAAIGDATYATLADAVAASTAGDTITLLDDVTENVTISKDIIVDGDDHQYKGKITLSKTGATIQNVNFVNSQIFKSKDSKIGTTTIKNCSFEGQIADSQYAINIGYAKKLVVENCSAKNVGFGFIYVPSEVDYVSVKDVNIDGATYGVHIVYNTESVFENVTIKNAYVGFMDQTYGAKTFTFKNCKVEADYPVAIWERKATTQTFIFKGGNNDFGTDDYTFGSTYVNSIVDVAKIGDEGYATVQAAIDATVAGDTVTLIKDVKENVTINKEVILDGAEHKYEGKITIGKTIATIKNVNFVNSQILKSKESGSKLAEVTVKNCSFDGQIAASQYAINVGYAKKLIVENCSAKNVGFGFIYVPSEVDYVSVKDVNIDGASYGVHIAYNTESVFENVTIKNAYVGIMNQSYGAKTLTFAGCNVAATFPAVIWERNATTQTYVFEGDNEFVAPEGTPWITDAAYGKFIAKCNVDLTSNVFGYVHTASAPATCQAAQICTVCNIELDAIKEHELSEYVSNNDADCYNDGTKTAHCIYDCGLEDTIVDEGTKKEHVDDNNNGVCDNCKGEFCGICGEIHNDMIRSLFCLLAEVIRLLFVFLGIVC